MFKMMGSQKKKPDEKMKMGWKEERDGEARKRDGKTSEGEGESRR